MKPLLAHYRELLALTQLYLHREHPPQQIKAVAPAAFAYFQKNGKSPLPSKIKDLPKQPPLPPVQAIKAVPQPAADFSPPPSAKVHSPVQPAQIPLVPETLSPPVKSENRAAPSQPPMNQTQTNKPISHSKALSLEPFSSQAAHDLNEIWKLHRQLFPDLSLSENIPKDAVALKIKNAWLNEQSIPPVVILSFREQEKELAFLKNVAQAVTLRLAQARVISVSKWEKENEWEKLLNFPDLRLVIATDYDLYLNSALMKHYREAPQQGKHYLNRTPLLLLSDLALYLKEHQLKSLLWRAICNEFADSQHAKRG